ncbi:MAG: hypothetical protein P8Y99_02595 [Calditrichaceae bacterium]
MSASTKLSTAVKALCFLAEDKNSARTSAEISDKIGKNIHLQEIYCSIEDRKAFHLDVQKYSGHHLSIPIQINNFFLDLFAEVQVDIEDKMTKISLQSIIDKLEK